MRQARSAAVAVLAVLAVLALPAAAAAVAGSVVGKVDAKAAKNRKNAVVYVERATAPEKPGEVKMDQRSQVFVPFVQPIVKGTTVEFLNSDATGHNVFSPDGEKFDLGVFDKDQSRRYTFASKGVYAILCKLHPSMIAYVISLQNPFFAVTGEDGSFRIENVPAGTYTLKVWHERKKAEPVQVTVAAQAETTADFVLR